MKLLLLSDLNSIHTKKWVQSLSEHGIELFVFGIDVLKSDFYDQFENVQCYSFGINVNEGSKSSYLKSRKQLKKICAEFQPDIVHAHYASSYGLLGSFLKHKSYFISVWGSDIFDFPKESFLKKAIIKRNLRKASVICSTSEVMARETKKYTHKAINVVPFGVDPNHFHPTHKPANPDELVFGIVKTLEDKYGISYLIQAFDLLLKADPSKKHTLLIVGGGSKEMALKTLVTDLHLEERVQFTGSVKHDEVAEYFNKMDIVVIPSTLDSESFGVAAVEAAACEKPVIVSNVGGLPEVVLHEVTGLVAEPKNAVDLFEKMKFLAESPEKIAEFGKAGRKNVLEKYVWSENVETMIQLYQKELR